MNNIWNYDAAIQGRRLEKIKERYFRPVMAYPEGHLTHHGDCSVHRSKEIYGTAPCNCGFLHDLNPLPESLVEKLYEKYYDDFARGFPEPEHSLSQEEMDDILEKTFGAFIKPTTEEWLEICGKDWQLIEKIFGKDFKERRESEYLKSEKFKCAG